MAANDPGQPLTAVAQTVTTDLPPPASALAIGAHPDDVEFGCGGVLAKWAAAGCTVHHLVCTDGSKGSWDPGVDPGELRSRREVEQREAARRLTGGRGEVRFLRHVDGELDSGLAVRADVAQVIRELRPEVVLGHDPWKRYRLHPDHRHAGLLACEGIVVARDPHFLRDSPVAPHRPDVLLLWEADEADHVEDVSDHVDTKLSALEAHESQFESTMHASDSAGIEAFRTRVRERLAALGEPFGMVAAELFKRIDDL